MTIFVTLDSVQADDCDKALQGAFAEHQAMIQKLSVKRKIAAILVRTTEDLHLCDALIIPGGGMCIHPIM